MLMIKNVIVKNIVWIMTKVIGVEMNVRIKDVILKQNVTKKETICVLEF
jgi:hypothetical protein